MAVVRACLKKAGGARTRLGWHTVGVALLGSMKRAWKNPFVAGRRCMGGRVRPQTLSQWSYGTRRRAPTAIGSGVDGRPERSRPGIRGITGLGKEIWWLGSLLPVERFLAIQDSGYHASSPTSPASCLESHVPRLEYVALDMSYKVRSVSSLVAGESPAMLMCVVNLAHSSGWGIPRLDRQFVPQNGQYLIAPVRLHEHSIHSSRSVLTASTPRPGIGVGVRPAKGKIRKPTDSPGFSDEISFRDTEGESSDHGTANGRHSWGSGLQCSGGRDLKSR
jgi:hypothetical protein